MNFIEDEVYTDSFADIINTFSDRGGLLEDDQVVNDCLISFVRICITNQTSNGNIYRKALVEKRLIVSHEWVKHCARNVSFLVEQ